MDMHADQLAVSSGMVRTLVDEQFPGWREQAIGLVWYYAASNPVMSRMGRRTLERIQASTAPAHVR